MRFFILSVVLPVQRITERLLVRLSIEIKVRWNMSMHTDCMRITNRHWRNLLLVSQQNTYRWHLRFSSIHSHSDVIYKYSPLCSGGLCTVPAQEINSLCRDFPDRSKGQVFLCETFPDLHVTILLMADSFYCFFYVASACKLCFQRLYIFTR